MSIQKAFFYNRLYLTRGAGLILLFFLTIGTSCTDRKKCYEFKSGNFAYTDETRIETIVRTDNMQVESNPATGVEIHTSIQWANECMYVMTFEKVLNHPKGLNEIIGSQLVVDIIETKGNKYKAHVKGGTIDEIIEFVKTN